MSAIAKIVLHCSDSPDAVDIGVKEIRAWHMTPPPGGRGWSNIGYHYVVRRDGVVEVGRYENGDSVLEGKEIGAHVQGHNSDSLAVCWVGRTVMTALQRTATIGLLCQLVRRHGLTVADVLGHYELDAKKTCPNLDMVAFRYALSSFPFMSAEYV